MTTFTDDFNRADGSPGANWVQVSGTWVIVSNQLSPGTTGGTVVLRAATAMASSDNFAQVTIAATTAVSQGVWCRGDSTLNSGYALRNNGSNWALFSVSGGTFTSIGTYSAAAVVGDVAKVQAVGSTIKAVINGVERISVTNTAVTTGTSVGIRSEANTGLLFDNFSAADVTSGATGDAALSGTATLSASGTRAASGSSALTATAALTTSGLRATIGNTALTATATLTSGLRATIGDTALTATATLTAAGQRATTAAANLAATATLGASGLRNTQVSAGLAATADLTAQGQVAHSATAALTATATLTADGVTGAPPVLGDAALNATGALTATGTRATSADTSLTATAALTATGATALAATAGIAATATLTASGTTHSTHDDVDITVGAPYSPWTAGPPHGDPWPTGTPQASDWEVAAPW